MISPRQGDFSGSKNGKGDRGRQDEAATAFLFFETGLGCGCAGGDDLIGRGQRAQQPIESDEVRDHQHGDVEDGDNVSGTHLPGDCGKAGADGVEIVEEDIGHADEIEGDDERPEERTHPYGEKREEGQHAGREVTIGGEGGKACGQMADDAWKDEDEPEEAEAVQGGDGAVGFEPAYRSESGQDIDAEAE